MESLLTFPNHQGVIADCNSIPQVERVAPCDMNSVLVMYSGTATGLGQYHGKKPTRHTSAFSGVNLFRFNHERSKIVEIQGALGMRWSERWICGYDHGGERVAVKDGCFSNGRHL